jgi:ABC-type transporter Mla subunit MlaD
MSSDQFPRAGSQGTQSTTHPTGSGARNTGAFDEVRERAGEAVSKFGEMAQEVREQAKETASSLAAEANQKAKALLNQQIDAGADLVNQIAGAAKQAARSLDPTAPQLAGLVRGAADRAEDLSRDLRGQSVDDLFRTASDFTRRQPALVFGLASVAGFLAFRVLKAAQPNGSQKNQQQQAQWAYQPQRDQFGQRPGEFHGR